MATPFVAGSAALILEKEPRLDPISVKERLLSAAEDRDMAKMTKVLVT